MHTFSVWAPLAQRIAVGVNGKAHPMAGPDAHGWWCLEVEDAGPGTDYGFLVDDDEKLSPDPRSLWQPNGVHALSRVYDHYAFPWQCYNFQSLPLASAVLYELHVGTFTAHGTLDAAINQLKHLGSLGITHLELMPIASFDGRHGWGYDGVALYSVHEPYGGPDALKRFVDAAHQEGLAVLLDVVYNHFGPSGNYTGRFGPYLTDSHSTPWGGAVNLEAEGSDQVRRFFCDNALMWLRDYKIDGLRLDAVHAFVDRSAIHFLEQLTVEVEALESSSARCMDVIAESDLNDPRIVTPREAGGLGIDAQWSDDFHHALFAVLCKDGREGYYADFGSIGMLAKALEETFVYDGIYSQHRNRIHGRAIEKLSQHRFLGYIQNHDQVGNRALGERISITVGMNRAKIAAAIVLMSPFIPMLFQGEEWATSSPFQYFADHGDPAIARAVSEGRKKEFAAFGWKPSSIPDPESMETFERSRLDWRELEQSDHASMLQWYRDLIHLRRTTSCLNDGEPGNISAAYKEEEEWLQFTRGWIAVICNFAQMERTFAVSPESTIVLASRTNVHIHNAAILLPAETVAVIRTTRQQSCDRSVSGIS